MLLPQPSFATDGAGVSVLRRVGDVILHLLHPLKNLLLA
jgi:hypothetical protein